MNTSGSTLYRIRNTSFSSNGSDNVSVDFRSFNSSMQNSVDDSEYLSLISEQSGSEKKNDHLDSKLESSL